jgi:hypothetical protein
LSESNEKEETRQNFVSRATEGVTVTADNSVALAGAKEQCVWWLFVPNFNQIDQEM